MFFLVLTTLLCVLGLNHMSKILSSKLHHKTTNSSMKNQKLKKIHPRLQDSAHQQQQQQKSPFLSLPAELRLQIYALVLPSSHPFILGRDYGHPTAHFKHPALMHLSRQIRAETLPLFFKRNTFIVDVHQVRDLRAFLRWVGVLERAGGGRDGGEKVEGGAGAGVEAVSWMQDFRITVGGCLLVDVVLKAGRRRYGDARVVAAEPMLNNSLRWDRKNILHYVRDTTSSKAKLEVLLENVGGNNSSCADNGLRVSHLVEMVEIMFKIEKLDDATRKVFLKLKQAC